MTDRSLTRAIPSSPNTKGELLLDSPLARAQLLRGLSHGDYAGTFAAARIKEFRRGEFLYIEGDSVERVFLITSGLVKVTKLGQSGTEVILRLGVPGDVLGMRDQSSTGRYHATVQGVRPGQLLVWDGPAFSALVTSLPVLRQNIIRIIAGELLELEERFRELASQRVAVRLARQLVRLAKRMGGPGTGPVELRVPKEELAQMTGTTIFTVSRLLSAWKARGLVISGRETVIVCDVQSLLAISHETELAHGASA